MRSIRETVLRLYEREGGKPGRRRLAAPHHDGRDAAKLSSNASKNLAAFFGEMTSVNSMLRALSSDTGIRFKRSRRATTGMIGFLSPQAAPISCKTQLVSTELGVNSATTTSLEDSSFRSRDSHNLVLRFSSVVNTSAFTRRVSRLRTSRAKSTSKSEWITNTLRGGRLECLCGPITTAFPPLSASPADGRIGRNR